MAAKLNVNIKMVKVSKEEKKKLRQKLIEAILNKDE